MWLRQVGIAIPERSLHAMRHTFALKYFRNGESVFHLRKTLGRSSLGMTRRCVGLTTEDWQRTLPPCSLLRR